MILVDTSVWVDHLREGNAILSHLLYQGSVCVHPMIVGELACGFLKNRDQILDLLNNLTPVNEATHSEVMHCIERHQMMGKGVGFVDVHLLAACLLTGNTQFWTKDKRLANIAQSLAIAYVEPY